MLTLLVNGVLKAAVDIRRKELSGNRRMRKRAKRSPEEEARRFSDRRRGLKQILIGRQAGQRLYVADIDHSIRRNERMSRSDDAIQPVDSDKEIPVKTDKRRYRL